MRFIKAFALFAALLLVALFLVQAARASNDTDAAALKAFYTARGDAFYWQGAGGLTPDAEYFITVLTDSWKHGLNPDSYHLEKINMLKQEPGPDSVARLEVLLGDALVRYARDMSGMRVNPKDFNLDPKEWRTPLTAEQSLTALAQVGVRSFLDGLAPKSQTYRALQDELVRLVQGPPEPYLNILPIEFDRSLNPGERHKKIPDLRLRLGVAAQTTDPYLYDDRLAGAVMKFQRDSGLPSEGVIGPTTLKLLNHSKHDRMLQIIANLERLRWVDENRPERFVMVNIPAATLWAVDHNAVAFQMPVVVGKAERPTESFTTKIEGVRFNPGWTVPPTIKREDILPKLRANPAYLNDKGMELVLNAGGESVTLDPRTIDWNTITNKDLSALSMVQIPGAHNPLGSIRILMPNRFNIYLHDTNEPEYFDRKHRAQSSGCIRMKEPGKMAEFVLQDVQDFNDTKMKALISGGKTRDVKIPVPIPVYILYYSAWADEQGRVVFGNDIYGLDKKLIERLSVIDGFILPGHNERSTYGPFRP